MPPNIYSRFYFYIRNKMRECNISASVKLPTYTNNLRYSQSCYILNQVTKLKRLPLTRTETGLINLPTLIREN